MVVLPSWAGVAFPLLLSPCGRCGFGWSHVHILLQGGAALPSSSCCCDIFLRLLWVVRRSPLTFFRGAAGPPPSLGGAASLASFGWCCFSPCLVGGAALGGVPLPNFCGAVLLFPRGLCFSLPLPFFTSFRVVRRGCLFFGWCCLPPSPLWVVVLSQPSFAWCCFSLVGFVFHCSFW